MKNNYRIVTNKDVLEIIMKDKIIKLTLLDREGVDVGSKILKEVYTPKMIEGYDTPQFELEPDFHEIVNSFYHDEMMIWGIKEQVNISLPDEEIEYKEELCWYFDRKIKEVKK